MPKQERAVYWVRFSKAEGLWVVTQKKVLCSSWPVKTKAVAEAVRLAKQRPKALAQVKVCGKDGRIQREFTYGADPVRSKG
jgi:hypothetical protein